MGPDRKCRGERDVRTVVVNKIYILSGLQYRDLLPVGEVLREGTGSTSALFADVACHAGVESITTYFGSVFEGCESLDTNQRLGEHGRTEYFQAQRAGQDVG